MKKTPLLAVFATLLAGSLKSASAVTVPATANIFGAISLTGAGDGSGTAPPGLLLFNASSIEIIGALSNRMTPISCSLIFCAGGNGADGGTYADLSGGTNITAPGNGISGISFTGDVMFLVGVFIDSSSPPSSSTTAPPTLNYGSGGPLGATSNATDAPIFQPALNQVFFIGDGTEGYYNVCPGPIVDGMACSGIFNPQIFVVPGGATELFLGFADGPYIDGTPAYYNDNSGSLDVTVFAVGTPEPGGMTQMALGLAACALLRMRAATIPPASPDSAHPATS